MTLNIALTAIAALLAGLVGYELIRRDLPWDRGRVARILLGTFIFAVLWWARD